MRDFLLNAITRGAEGPQRDLVWLSFEGPCLAPFPTLLAQAPDSAAAPPGTPDTSQATDDDFLLGATIWSDGTRHDRLLARSHPHGRWVRHLDVRA